MPKTSATQSRYVHVKTILPAGDVVAWITKRFPQAQILWAQHDEETVHTHFSIAFPSVTRWTELRTWLMDKNRDPHSYSASARSWVRSCRYLLHLDNPEKKPIPFENLQWRGIDDLEVSQLMGGKKSPLLSDLAACVDKKPFEAFEYLVCQRGHHASEVSSAIRCLIDLERFNSCKKVLNLPRPSLSQVEFPGFDSDREKIADLSSDFHDFTLSDFEGF